MNRSTAQRRPASLGGLRPTLLSPLKCLALATLLVCVLASGKAAADAVTLVQNSKPLAGIYINPAGTQGSNDKVIEAAGQWLADELAKATGEKPSVVIASEAQAKPPIAGSARQPLIVLALADIYPKLAAEAKLDRKNVDAYAIIPSDHKVLILGNTAYGVSHGVAHLLHHMGFRYYSPMPNSHIIPKLKNVTIDAAMTSAPVLRGRSIWYAYGTGPDKELGEFYKQWTLANRMPTAAPFHNGHAYGNIISRNREAFDAHPEYYAMLENGERDAKRAFNARKFCVSNPGLIKLVVEDRIKLLEERRAVNPYEFMVSVDPSDGQGVCLCENCKKIGTPTDRVFFLVNKVAKALREKYPDAWAGLYAYSSHRLPPTIDVEPNVYVQVAMGFNRTKYSLPELVGAWAEKVNALGLREYYGVEAWDWGLPGRMRGGQVDYHQKWIPYYSKKKLNAINGETNANWGAQTLGLYVASRLMWNPEDDVQAISDEYYKLSFGKAAKTMESMFKKFDEAPQLKPFALAPIFEDLNTAYEQAGDDKEVRTRIVDMMSYLHYVHLLMEFQEAEARDRAHGDEYYNALKPLMQFAWQTRMRGVVHYYALARRLCNGLPLKDKRFEFWYALTDKNRIPKKFLDDAKVADSAIPNNPVWKVGEEIDDAQIRELFAKDLASLKEQAKVIKKFSDELVPVTIEGNQTGGSQIFLKEELGLSRFRYGLTMHILSKGAQTVTLQVAPDSRKCDVELFDPQGNKISSEVLYQRVAGANDSDETDDNNKAQAGDNTEVPLRDVTLKIPGEGIYKLTISPNFRIAIPADLPIVMEASPAHPAHLEYSGYHYFYVPKTTDKLRFDVGGRLSLYDPTGKRTDYSADDRAPGKSYIEVDLTPETRGKVWHTFTQSRGTFYFINIPPYLSFFRNNMILPKDVQAADRLAPRK